MIIKQLFILIFLVSIQCSFAQIGVGTRTPHSSAKLEVSATNKGFLPPRIGLTSSTDNLTIPNPATGLLVYCTGASGLTAGYYYWNGSQWVVIATAAGTGNVASPNMVKLYDQVFSNANGKINHSNGFAFTVPVSARYQFTFISSVGFPDALATVSFYIRNGSNSILASDNQTSWNNNRSEVFGKMELDLVAGITYNLYCDGVSGRDNNDWDRVYYKQVPGNLPINIPFAINLGGTAGSSAVDAITNLLPSQGGQNGKLLKTNATSPLWDTITENLTDTTEIATNKTYFGRTVYRKKFKGSFANSTFTFDYFNIPNLYLLVDMYGIVQRSGYNWNDISSGNTRVYLIGNGAQPNLSSEVWVDRQNGRLVVYNLHSFFVSQPYHLVIEYIKTTGPSLPSGVGDN